MSLRAQNCVECGERLIPNPDHPRKRFCNQTCRGKYWSGERNVNWAKRTSICGACGKPFQHSPSARGKFCSRICYWTAKKGTYHGTRTSVERACQQCGKKFTAKLSWVAKKGQARFCSKSCAAKVIRLGIRNPAFKDGLSHTKVGLNRYAALRLARKKGAEGEYSIYDIIVLRLLQADRCAYCETYIPDCYEIDHIHPLARGGSNWPSNLQLLCKPCNMRKWAKVA